MALLLLLPLLLPLLLLLLLHAGGHGQVTSGHLPGGPTPITCGRPGGTAWCVC
jgi:hypothetical protein